MYSNNIYAFFFIITLCFTPLISSSTGRSLQLLRQNYYDDTCPNLLSMVMWGVWNATQSDPRVVASLLRLHFHDCFVNGCDASVLLDDTPTKQGEKSATPNKNSLRGFEVIDNIKKDVETWCPPKTVSCADILTLAARAAVKFALHADQPGYEYWYDPLEPWEVVLGRLDGMTSNKAGANSELPSPKDPVDTLITKFAAKGLNIQDLVALSGGHTIGFARCVTFKSSRLYLSSTSTNNMDRYLLCTLKGMCPNTNTSDNIALPLDWETTYVFDNNYYNNLVNQTGILLSDQALASDNRTSGLVYKYSNDPESFLVDFGASMVKMGGIDVITTRARGRKKMGEIRSVCGSTN